jgi:DNA-binding MarR family transcriptional regulator
LTHPSGIAIVVNTMNDNSPEPAEDLLIYQTNRLKDLLEELIHCCQLRTRYLSRKYELPQAELRCLLLFSGARYLTVKSLAQQLDVAKSRVTKVVNGMIKKNLLECVDDPKDGRVKLICTTQLGQMKCAALGSLLTDLHQRLLLELQPEERKAVLSSLELLRSNMEDMKKQLD